MRIGIKSVFLRALRALMFGTFGAGVALVAAFDIYLDNRADLKVWHRAELDEEFTADSDVQTFADYLALEERLFRQLTELVSEKVPAEQRYQINRYNRGSLSDPERWTINWNRSFELAAPTPKAAVLLLHGMSDSPYSLRHLGERFNAAGAHVLGLRLPGHGTTPSGLVHVTWEDMAGAVQLALRHLASLKGDRPLYVVGYSNGAALAVRHALAALDDPALVPIEQLPGGSHELVLFDLNRMAQVEPLLKSDPGPSVEALQQDRERTFTLNQVTNATPSSRQVEVRTDPTRAKGTAKERLGLAWPADLYSLTHVALPLPPNDSLYGGVAPDKSPDVRLGDIALRGERGVLHISASEMLRLRWNPFYPYMEKRVLRFLYLNDG